ncbi:MAG: ATP-binding protein [Ruminococcaceae bacterium]|nr:ATP-binding protein [Oscillospiraceae bacterium]
MLKTEELYKTALEEKKSILAKKTALYERSLAAAYDAEPQLRDIDFRLSALGAKIAITALSGNKAEFEKIQNEMTCLTEKKRSIISKFKIPEIVYDCEKCKDTGYIDGRLCSCIKEKIKEIAINELSADMPIKESRFDNFNLNYYQNIDNTEGANPQKRMTAILKLCREYADNFNPKSSKNLLFMGDSGLGKTHLTLAVVSEIIKKGYNVIYGSAYNLFSMIENEHFSSIKGDSYENMLECDLLVIDDLGTEFVTAFTQSVLYGLVNSRILSGRPTIINTNLTMADIEKRYSPRISSRFIGNYTAKKFIGADIRQIKALEKQ